MQKCLKYSKYQDIIATSLKSQTYAKVLKNLVNIRLHIHLKCDLHYKWMCNLNKIYQCHKHQNDVQNLYCNFPYYLGSKEPPGPPGASRRPPEAYRRPWGASKSPLKGIQGLPETSKGLPGTSRDLQGLPGTFRELQEDFWRYLEN